MNHISQTTAEATLKAQKRSAIVNAATDCFHRFGFDHASMDSIAQHANVSKRTVYNHFPSKDLLFVEIVDQLKADAATAFHFQYDSTTSLLQQLRTFSRSVIDFHCRPDSRQRIRILVSRFLDSPELANTLFGNAKIFEGSLSDWIRCAKRQRRLISCDVPFAAKQHLALLESFVVWPQLLKNAPVPEGKERLRIARGAAEMFVARYATEESVRPRQSR